MLGSVKLALAASVPLAVAGMKWPEGLTADMLCEGGACANPQLKYETLLPGQPGYQWNDAGGYCGSWSTQRATLMQGAYISQGQVRNHTYPGGGNDEEILSTNIVEAYNNLKLDFEGFDYKNYTAPMQQPYFKWLKKQLVAGYPVVWMIMWSGQQYPIYKSGFDRLGFEAPPAGMYGHVEPVMGIQSNHPFTDEEVYDDDVIVHFNDGGSNTIYRPIKELPGDWTNGKAVCQGRYCIGPYSFGWAIKGFQDNHAFQPATLAINPSRSEPDIRSGAKPSEIHGKLTCSKLTAGSQYSVYRWDTVEEAFTYESKYLKSTFTAKDSSYVYEDPTSFMSDGTTYYRCVPAAA